MAFNRPDSVEPFLNINGITRGTIAAAAITFLGSIALGTVYHVSGLMDSSLSISSSVIMLIGVLSGGFLAARKANAKGLYHGISVGISTFIIILLLALFTPVGFALVPVFKKLLICLIGGAIGGILGVSV